ncbi:MAG: DUF2807 domain-containing protein [Rikenellaceae bacterium]|nr:DUF2807 domain-containing protein [Rikenellaceae bacterium]
MTFTQHENEDMRGLRIESNFQVEIIQGTNSMAVFEIDSELQNYVTSKLEDGLLIVEVKELPKKKQKNPYLKLKLHTLQINQLLIGGGSKIIVDGEFESTEEVIISSSGASKIENLTIKCPKINIDCSGASNLKSTISATELKIEVSGVAKCDLAITDNKNAEIKAGGVSDLLLKGSSENIKLTTSGSSTVRASELKAENVETDLSGASKVQIHAVKSLKAETSGGSILEYAGNPDDEKINSATSSSVSKVL